VGEKRPERDVDESRINTSSPSMHIPAADRKVITLSSNGTVSRAN
jgi:hypothetical protein